MMYSREAVVSHSVMGVILSVCSLRMSMSIKDCYSVSGWQEIMNIQVGLNLRPAFFAACRLSLLAAFFSMPIAIAQETVERDVTDRPRIGLVLGGGGAKGMAHIGVIRVLDELHVPIDCIAGTSMGALVGGAIAAGMPPAQLEAETIGIDWATTIGGKGARDIVPIERKLARKTYTNSIEVGIKDGRLAGVSGLIDTQDIEGVIRGLVADARVQLDFDELPISFRAIATDMVTGDMVVLDDGDISVAMRASMALPGVFSPVVIGDSVLADGGMVRNLPVDVARDLCADVVIAVWLSSPQPEVADLMSASALLGRSSDVMIEANEKLQIASLTDRDTGINVPMGDISSASFDRAADAVELGRAAAEAVASQLSRYAMPEQEYLAWREAIDESSSDTVYLTDVRVRGLKRVNSEYVQAQLRYAKAGSQATMDEIKADTNRVYALGDFERVDYRFTGPRDKRVLEIWPVEKTYGPNFFRADLGLAGDTNSELMANLRVDHDLVWLNSYGGRWHNAVQLGRQTILRTDFYQPVDVQQSFFVQPILSFESSLEDIYVDGSREARYFLQELYGEIDVGANIGNTAQIRTGLQSGLIGTRRDTGLTLLPELDRERDSNIYVGAVLDTRDNVGLETRGTYMYADFRDSGSWLSGEQNYTMAEGVISHTIPISDNALNILLAGGSELDGELPPTRDFLLGGIRSFPGLQINELRGTSYWVAGANYRQKVANIWSLLNQSLYAGVRLRAGRVGGRRDGVNDGALYGISGGLGGRTPIGAFNLSLGYVTNDSWALQFAIGAPIAEGTALDQIN